MGKALGTSERFQHPGVERGGVAGSWAVTPTSLSTPALAFAPAIPCPSPPHAPCPLPPGAYARTPLPLSAPMTGSGQGCASAAATATAVAKAVAQAVAQAFAAATNNCAQAIAAANAQSLQVGPGQPRRLAAMLPQPCLAIWLLCTCTAGSDVCAPMRHVPCCWWAVAAARVAAIAAIAPCREWPPLLR